MPAEPKFNSLGHLLHGETGEPVKRLAVVPSVGGKHALIEYRARREHPDVEDRTPYWLAHARHDTGTKDELIARHPDADHSYADGHTMQNGIAGAKLTPEHLADAGYHVSTDAVSPDWRPDEVMPEDFYALRRYATREIRIRLARRPTGADGIAGLTRGQLSAVRRFINTWTREPHGRRGVPHDWDKLFSRIEPLLEKLRGQITKPVTVYRSESLREGPSQYSRHTAWSTQKSHAEDWLPSPDRRVIMQNVEPTNIAFSIPHINFTLEKAGLKPIEDHQQEVVLKPHSPETHRSPPTRASRLARVKVPAGGQITGGGTQTGGVYQRGGQFGAKARRRIRDTVLSWLRGRVQLARPKKKKESGDLKPADLAWEKPAAELEPTKDRIPQVSALDAEIHRAKGADASPEKLRAPLTIRELKDVESSLALPPKLHLTKHPINRGKTDNDNVGAIDLDTYYTWANNVARHVQKSGIGAKALERLRNPKHLSRAKLSFLVGRMTREIGQARHAFADTGGASAWYGDHVGAMTRHLHDEFHSGKPQDDELWGKLDKKTGRVKGGAALTLAKMFVAATSGGMKPHENYDTAHAMIASGRRAAQGSENPFKSIPDNQGEDFRAWVDGVAHWHSANDTGVTREQILTPGRNLKDRALWYEKVVAPLPKTLSGGYGSTNSAARYSGVSTRFVGDPKSDHYGAPIWVDKGKGGKRSPYPAAVDRPRYAPLSPTDGGRLEMPEGHTDYSGWLEDNHTGKGQVRAAKLPAVDHEGRLAAPGWTARNEQVLDGRDKINGVVAYFTDRAKGDVRQGMKDAAQFFLTEQPQSAFDKIIDWTRTHDEDLARRLEDSSKGNRGFYFEGQPLPGAFLLGPKFGAFSLNLHLDDPEHAHLGKHLTADLWWSRDWNVMLGSLFGPKNDQRGRQETPRGGTKSSSNPERKLMRKVAQIAAERAGLDNVAQLQAVLWYYEQLKPQWFGVDTSSTSYLDGANAVAGRKRERYRIDKKTGNILREKISGKSAK